MAFTQLVLKTRKIDCIRIYQIVLVTPGTHMKHNCRTLALRISLKADAKRPSRAACSSVSRASQNGALLNILWSILKQFEALWNSLNSRSRNSLKQSEADWSQTQYYMAQLRSLTTQGLHFSLLGINLLNLSHRHSTNHTLELLRGQKQDLQMPKKTCLQHLATAHFRNLEDKWPSIKNHQTRSDSNHTKAISNHTKHYKTLPQKAWHSRSWSWRQEKSIVFEFIKLS